MDNETKWDVWRLAADSPKTPPTRILGSPFNEFDARVSPDGKWMAFVSDQSGRNEIYVTAFPAGGEPQQISLAGGEQVGWSRNGRELFYAAGDGRLTAVQVRADTAFTFGPAKALFAVPRKSFLGGNHTYAVSNDGSRFLVMIPAGTQPPKPPVQVIVNWKALLSR
jgi:Tol biopolymer transport system component